MSYRTRFAPSPNGRLHIGHALSALMVQKRAEAMGGVWLLRHEDIDLARCPPENAIAIEEDLKWLGLRWHGAAIYQSERIGAHKIALQRLEGMGLLYPCFATRGEIRDAIEGRKNWPNDPDGSPLYPGLYKALSSDERAARIARGEPFALRLDMEKALGHAGALSFQENGTGADGEKGRITADPSVWGDVVLARKDIGTSYHIAVVVDDAANGITEVVRGVDIFPATSLHRLLQTLLQFEEPDYFHHPLIMGADGRKLSKSEGAEALSHWREQGRTADELIAHITIISGA